MKRTRFDIVKRMTIQLILVVIVASLGTAIAATPVEAAGIIYVDADATSGANDGSSWNDAYLDLQNALEIAGSGDEIWVAAGTYKPTIQIDPSDPRSATFQMMNGVAMYGGFDPSLGDDEFAERDWETNDTVLGGDIGTAGDNSDNCYHVFYHPQGLNLDDTAILDGFTVAGGNADGSYPHDSGGGMFNISSSPKLSNCIISNNTAVDGAGMFNDHSSAPMITNCVFTNNASSEDGGAICNLHNSSPNVIGCRFESNIANKDGGGIFNAVASNPSLINCVFFDNEATGSVPAPSGHVTGGGGGIFNWASSPNITNCTFFGNRAEDRGGALSSYDEYSLESSPIVVNSIFWANTGYNTINGSASVTFSVIQDVRPRDEYIYPGTGNIDMDPLLTSDLHLTASSPCIDSGDNTVVTEIAIDFENDPRIVDGDRNGTATADMGADEYVGLPLDWDKDGILDDDDNCPNIPNPGQHDSDGDGSGDACDSPDEVWIDDDWADDGYAYGDPVEGHTWSYDAFSSIQEGIDNVGNSTVHVSPGTYYESIIMRSGVQVLGAGAEVTTIDGGDGTGFGSLVTAVDVDTTAKLDGFAITNGLWNSGGGLYILRSELTVSNCIFSHNEAYGLGGAVAIFHGAPNILNCGFISNKADHGGAIGNTDSSPSIVDCTFQGNHAYKGGAICNENISLPRIDSCTFINNGATWDGGAVYNRQNSSAVITHCTFEYNDANYGGGIHSKESSSIIGDSIFIGNSAWAGGGIRNEEGSSPTVINCTFAGNVAAYGGGISNDDDFCSPVITNCTFTQNGAYNYDNGSGGAISRGSPVLTNCILWENTPGTQWGNPISDLNAPSATVSFCNIQVEPGMYPGDIYPGNGNTNENPRFVHDPDPGPDGNWDGIDDDNGDFHLLPSSPCIDAGDNFAPNLPSTDFEGDARTIDGDGNGIAVVDMGADEVYEVGPGDYDGDGIPDIVDNCPSTANPNQEDTDGDGIGDACDACNDSDSDGVCDPDDNCVNTPNPDQTDSDGDGIGDACDDCSDFDNDGVCDPDDNCPGVSNPDQTDSDGDGAGDICDTCPDDPLDDADFDGICGDLDNCPYFSNPNQEDSDGDGIGDVCDDCIDTDDDTICDDVDNCPNTPNPNQEDSDGDGIGDACDDCIDTDDDTICDDVDNCPGTSNSNQEDTDEDGIGDVCDDCPSDADNDSDGDGVCSNVDNCENTSNSDQVDSDGDAIGDACDSCPNDSDNDIDGDGVCGDIDNCPSVSNPNQEDIDNDGIGDACDPVVTPDFSVQMGTELTDQLFIDEGVICSSLCTMTLDYSEVDTSALGSQTYTVTCGEECGGISDQGTVTVIATNTVTFVAGAGGSLIGETTQTLPDGGNCTTVTAQADPNNQFINWTIIGAAGSGSFGNPYQAALTITNVNGDIQATANFRISASGGGAPAAGGGGGGAPAGGGGVYVPSSVPKPSPTPTPKPSPTVVPAPPPPPPAPPTEEPEDLVTEDLTGNIGSDGITTEPITIASADGSTTLVVPAGTLAQDSEGRPLNEITVQPPTTEPPIPPERYMIAILDFGPDGANFDPAITLTISFDADALPEGVAPVDLVLAYYDEVTGEWVELTDTVVDLANNTASATISHFTHFAVQTRDSRRSASNCSNTNT